MHRIGIIPFDTKKDAMALLFVTSQTRGRWILPKGLAKKGESHVETCHREGFEEAGVRGVVLESFPVTVAISKQTDDGMQQIPVTYYPYYVQKQEEKWPEQTRRERHWALLEDATKVLYRDDFLVLIKQFETLRTWVSQAAEQHKS
jgi:8-oxo-dGTP pyrophosphatase MutT (NUDIX family)